MNRKKRSLKRKRPAAPKRKKKRTTTMNQIHGTRYVKKSTVRISCVLGPGTKSLRNESSSQRYTLWSTDGQDLKL